jgi:hypothetical protein
MPLLVCLVVSIPIEFHRPSHHNKSWEDKQLDDGIVDTLVLALLVSERLLDRNCCRQRATAGAQA